MSELFAVVYSSQAVGDLDKFEKMAREIEAQSLENNQEVGISGLLLFRDGLFLQWLEGRQSDVEKLMSRIAKDSRHNSIHRIFEGNVAKRKYPNWSMKAVQSSKVERDILQGFLGELNMSDGRKTAVDDVAAQQILEIFEAYNSRILTSLS